MAVKQIKVEIALTYGRLCNNDAYFYNEGYINALHEHKIVRYWAKRKLNRFNTEMQLSTSASGTKEKMKGKLFKCLECGALYESKDLNSTGGRCTNRGCIGNENSVLKEVKYIEKSLF